MKKLDIIVPVFNESGNIKDLASRIDAAMKAANLGYRIIFVDDRSTDDTVEKIKEVAKLYPVKFHLKKKNLRNKAFSIIQGAQIAQTPYVVMIDGDLQYPPEAIPELVRTCKGHAVVVANRKKTNTGVLRSVLSKANRLVFGNVLRFGVDTQSGLKFFRREIVDHIDQSSVTKWTFDMHLLQTALDLGGSISSIDIDFEDRKNGVSKISPFRDSLEIGLSALKLKARKKRIYEIRPRGLNTSKGAGVIYRRKKYITHTRLHHQKSAVVTLTREQKLFVLGILALSTGVLLIRPTAFAVFLVAILSLIYFADVIFSLYVLLKSLHFPPELTFSRKTLSKLKDSKLPVYTILCPLYRESRVIGQFVRSISRLDWPKEKLEVILLLEKDDRETINAAARLHLPEYVRVLVVPDSLPKTKPKACNYGLTFAKGEYVVIYDAEDRPDRLQLKKAYLAFKRLGKKYFCIQSKLNYFNPRHNLLTRLFTTEYSLWFDVILPGLQSIEATIPLGGTSNHFRTKDLQGLHAWDPFNVTEDCDLGVRIFKEGYKTAIIDSVTLEEANSRVKNWIRQRSRWIKGYFQTYLVHMRNPLRFIRTHGIQAVIFQLVIGMRMSFMLINPFLWAATISYFALYSLVGPTIESLYPAPVFYIAVTSLVFGNFMYIYNYMIGAAKRRHWGLIKFVFFIPFYWLLTSVAAFVAFYQLIFKPHYWEKTHHGFHLSKKEKRSISPILMFQFRNLGLGGLKRIKNYMKPDLISGSFLILSTLIGNFFSFLYNAYLGRKVELEEFGLLILFGSFVYLSQVLISSLGKTFIHQSAYLFGKYGGPVKQLWTNYRRKLIKLSFFVAIVWIILSPILSLLFKAEAIFPFIVFSPVWIIGIVGSLDAGFLGGSLYFGVLSFLIIAESISKFAFTILFIETGNDGLVYLSIPLSMFISFSAGYLVVKRMGGVKTKVDLRIVNSFPKKFFTTSVISRLSSVIYLSLDLVLAKIFLSPDQAGVYALVSIVGKMVYFISSLFGQFIIPYISRAEGANRQTRKSFVQIFSLIGLSSFFGVVFLGFLGRYTAPFLMGPKATLAVPYLSLFALGMAFHSISANLIAYNQVKARYEFPIIGLFLEVATLLWILFFHANVRQFSLAMFAGGTLNLVGIVFTQMFYGRVKVVARNVHDFLGLFWLKLNGRRHVPEGKLRILVFNWRDTKHRWAGGAEVYVYELAKRWVKAGHKVTLFCGNDGKNPRNEVIDGVQIVRRGGFYTVYLWAFLYYVFKFRRFFDVVVDSENGIPFFAPLYTRKPVIGLVHHVHNELILKELRLPKILFPVGMVAKLLETRIMPFVYRNSQMVTVSNSSKKDMKQIGFGNRKPIEIVNPGVDLNVLKPSEKTKNPTVLYLGRLKPYKSLDTLIKAIAKLVPKIPKIELLIAGYGEMREELEQLAWELGIKKHVKFLGRVSEEEKVKLLGSSWVFAYPSAKEGWGISIIEANACGTPVIASRVPGLKDSVQNPITGFLVPFRDEHSFADLIEELVDDPKLRAKMSESALDWSKKFTWDRASENFLKLMFEIAHSI